MSALPWIIGGAALGLGAVLYMRSKAASSSSTEPSACERMCSGAASLIGGSQGGAAGAQAGAAVSSDACKSLCGGGGIGGAISELPGPKLIREALHKVASVVLPPQRVPCPDGTKADLNTLADHRGVTGDAEVGVLCRDAAGNIAGIASTSGFAPWRPSTTTSGPVSSGAMTRTPITTIPVNPSTAAQRTRYASGGVIVE